MKLYRLIIAFILLTSLPASAQQFVYSGSLVNSMCNGGALTCKIWYGTALTNASGVWSVILPPSMFNVTVQYQVTVISSDTTIANSAIATLTSQSITSATGLVVIPNSIVVGGTPLKAAGAGLTVNVLAVGF